ncbi:MAG: flagellin [Campylobacterota bacterium]|nr:flagellin [Campylobacterota bacterium]
MQIGRLEMIDQAQVDHVTKISKIQEAEEKVKVDPDEKYKNLQNKVDDNTNDVILDNVKFGFNEETKEFFVRVTKGDIEYQYPTEDMFRLKQSLMDAYKESKSE